jgi:YHS domain-containing protein
MAIDPVCGMEVEEKTAVHTSVVDGRTYYFCAPGCKRSFDQNPSMYINQAPPPAMPHSHHG